MELSTISRFFSSGPSKIHSPYVSGHALYGIYLSCHKDIRMTMRYAHLTKNHRASAVETIVPTKAEKARRSGFRIVGGKKTGTA